jgi:pSer/pThr/pTyr-binding forkhead associated (FHA) protein
VILASAAPHIEIEVTFDESNAEAPQGAPPRKFSLYDEESLIGRRSSSIPQTVGLEGDDGVSRRHLLIIRQADGSYVARLFDNTNGGTLNDTEMTAGVEAPLAEGDKIAIGAFTVIRVNAVR